MTIYNWHISAIPVQQSVHTRTAVLYNAISSDCTADLNQFKTTLNYIPGSTSNIGELYNLNRQILSCRQPWQLICKHRYCSGENYFQYNQWFTPDTLHLASCKVIWCFENWAMAPCDIPTLCLRVKSTNLTSLSNEIIYQYLRCCVTTCFVFKKFNSGNSWVDPT